MSARASHFELPFCSLLVYSPRGASVASRQSRAVRDGVKNDTPPVIDRAIARLSTLLGTGGLDVFFGGDVTLVPVPRRAPLRTAGSLWPGRRICEAILQAGLAKDVFPCLERFVAVPKSAYAAPGKRPSVQVHRDSMRVSSSILIPSRITLVDDFVTKGTTLLAAAELLRGAFPTAEIRAFALVRTMGLVPDVQRIVDPCVGGIWYEAGEAKREP